MKNIYKESINAISKGVPFSINIMKRNFSLGKRYIIKGGKMKKEIEYGIPLYETLEEVCDEMDRLYEEYYTSVPGEKSERQRHSFQSIDLEELTDEDLVSNMERGMARARLELYILLAIMSGQLVWDNRVMGGTFFRQSKVNPHFILQKELICSI